MDRRNYVVQVQGLLGGHGKLRLLKRDSIGRYVFFVPHGIRYLVDRCCQVILANVNHQ